MCRLKCWSVVPKICTMLCFGVHCFPYGGSCQLGLSAMWRCLLVLRLIEHSMPAFEESMVCQA